MNKTMLCSVLALVGAVVACSPSDGKNGSNGAVGPASTVQGPQGPEGPQGPPSTTPGPTGATGAQGPAGQNSEVPGPMGDAGVSLCGDAPMPEWHQPCNSVGGFYADSTPVCTVGRWECHARLSDNGDVEQYKVCADATTHDPVWVSAATKTDSAYANNSVHSLSTRCDEDLDCDGSVDVSSGVIGGLESNQPTMKLGDVLTMANATWAGHNTGCAAGSVACVNGVVSAANLVNVQGIANIGQDCFDPNTQLEHTFACNAGGSMVPTDSPDNDGDPQDFADFWYLPGVASVSCNGPNPPTP